MNNPLRFRDLWGLDTTYYYDMKEPVVVTAERTIEKVDKTEYPGTPYISDGTNDSYSETKANSGFVPLGVQGLSPFHSRVSANVNVYSMRGIGVNFLKVVVRGNVPLQEAVLFTTWMGAYYLYQNGTLLQTNGLNIPALDLYATSNVTADATIMLPNNNDYDLKIQLDCVLHTESGNAVSQPLIYNFHIPSLIQYNP